MPKDKGIQSVLVIGSGPIVIGQAAEFDYAGTQACMTLKEEGIRVILINNNPATIMTDNTFSDVVYFEPLTVENIEKIIQKERPDGILASLGGQTGLNLALALDKQGILDKYGVRLLGTSIEAIIKGEDREAFRSLMYELNEPVPESEIVSSVEEAVAFSERVGFPIIIRPAYTLGGSGGGIVYSKDELMATVKFGLELSPIHQCLIEMSIAGYKEIEYEMMRDANDTCIAICNMENVDPVGVHTGDSIVVAPTMTLTHEENKMLHEASVKIIRALGIIGGCNIQFALHPESKQYYLIEVNPRVSRSSALASKATGYPIAKMTTKLALGYRLDEVVNPVTGYTYAAFEPAIDYIVVKFPRFPFDKFREADRTLGTQMKATGEVMAIGSNLAGAFQKAIRSLELKTESFYLKELQDWSYEALWTAVKHIDDRRFFAILELLKRGETTENIHQETNINYLYLNVLHHLVQLETEIQTKDWQTISKEAFQSFKENGFTDMQLANLWGITEQEVTEKRKSLGILPSYKMVDTCAGEFTAQTPYFYSTWSGVNEAIPSNKKKVVILGSGPIRIGQGIEFDYCSVHGVFALKQAGYETIMINNNPETVSTDYVISDRLYFEPLTIEDVMAIIELEQPEGVIVQFGGQTAISLAEQLEKRGVALFGTKSATIDMLEDRDLFYQFLNKIQLPHIPGKIGINEQDVLTKAEEIGYPVLVRPSFVIGGQGMAVLHDAAAIREYVRKQQHDGLFPILIDAYYPGKEIEVDCITDGQTIHIPALIEHIERAGVHSGDSMAFIPAQTLTEKEKEKVYAYTKKIARNMDFKGLFNIQFVIYQEELYVLEINPRASRTVPVLSKITGQPLVEWAINCLLNKPLQQVEQVDCNMITVKAPIFSTLKLKGLDPLLGPEMKSTGELMAMAKTKEEALHKVFSWSEQQKLSLYEKRGELLIDPTSIEKEQLKEIIDVCIKAHMTPVVAEPIALEIPVKRVESFVQWINSEQALAVFSIANTDSSKKQRLKALSLNKSVFTEWPTLQAAIMGASAHHHTVTPIQEWINESKKEVIKQ